MVLVRLQVVAYFPEMKSSDKQLSDDDDFRDARRDVYHKSWKTVLDPLVRVQQNGGFVFRGKRYFPVISIIANDHPEALLMARVKNGGWGCRTC